MSSTNLIYDKCASEQYYKQSTSHANYHMYSGKFVNNKDCRIKFGILAGNDVSLYKNNLIDFESDMRGLVRPDILYPSIYYNSDILKHRKECDMFCYRPRLFASMPLRKTCNF